MQSGSASSGAAPFVAKTYGMVDDRATDAVVAWGPAGNSFVVADPFAFSRALLPAHFKHANFSSFVRQLNTYGFRKVDPDRWEFAHASFLRGQTHLLRHIVRRQSSGKRGKGDLEEDDEDRSSSSSSEMLAMEVARLRNEQRATEERVADMWRRVQETERRPKQMLAFLLRVVGDPDVLRRLASSSGSGPGEGAEVKRPRLLLDGDGAGVDGLSYHRSGNDLSPEEALVPEPSVDLYFAGADGFGDVQMDGSPPYGFHMDSSY
ncbi:heat stress transcription factor C-2a-like [Hordeum vulgare subsp. vulgare]|uniref:heat stress transcription factor C-2a-like n=1 Tax=Hordeum vulgare subsp. vulgare TaxID=112509 RepID=UPI000B48344E|nr:heat stress transcription factor C-2a-like [Hordeum vulgare subsp. vulgare]